MKESNSSIDSGRSSGGGGGGGGAAAAVVRGAAGGRGPRVEVGLDWEDCCNEGTAWGSSMVDEAMSSRRAVAASSLSEPVSTRIS